MGQQHEVHALGACHLRQPLVMGVALHPYIVGQPHRLRHLRRALRHIAERRDALWITTPGAICAHAQQLAAAQP